MAEERKHPMNKLIAVGTMSIVLAGCVGTSVPPTSDRDDAERFADRDYTYPNVRIGKLFGINPKVLANTNLFPVTGNSWHHYNLNLGKNENGFTTCTAHLEQDARTGQLALEYISLERTLKPGADDAELLRECRNAISWINDRLGTDMELDALADLKKMRDRHKSDRNRCALTLCDTSVYANLGEGQQVHVSGHDAVFMKRGDEYIEMAPPNIEITFRVGEDEYCRRLKCKRRLVQKDGRVVPESEPTVKDMQTVSIGVDISEKLSAAMKKRDCERPRRAKPVAGEKKTEPAKALTPKTDAATNTIVTVTNTPNVAKGVPPKSVKCRPDAATNVVACATNKCQAAKQDTKKDDVRPVEGTKK